ncbi:hypothetical protein QR680_001090 [Steinernema hermaphroditum]|uniref:SXP/RAL-2 family protein Ani s 5-like cation-binding domain-containing protein n=1 Tax=Steinernema hermaphroditum TaxID=289476 RepID=A0AA39LF83_9BILA|nr:hypothetical protein QR680_001090 [Steinernema hermaphroditum]
MVSSLVRVVSLSLLLHLTLAGTLKVYNPPATTENTVLRFQKQLLGIVRDPNAVIKPSDVKAKVNMWLDSLDTDSRKQYNMWLTNLENFGNRNVKDVLVNLSTESQRVLTRIMMIQQNENYDQVEKRERIKHVIESVKKHVRDEISRNFQSTPAPKPLRSYRIGRVN